MNRGELRTFTARSIGDKNQTRYTKAEYNQALDEANKIFTSNVRAYKDTTYTTADGDADYDLPSDFGWEKAVELDNKPLMPITRKRLSEKYPDDDWTIIEGKPEWYIVDPDQNRKELLLFPKPNANYANLTLRLWYYFSPADMSADSSKPIGEVDYYARVHIGVGALAGWLLLLSEELTDSIIAKMRFLEGLWKTKEEEAITTIGNTKSAPLDLRGGRGNSL